MENAQPACASYTHKNSHMISVKFADRFAEKHCILMLAKARPLNYTSTYDFGERVIENAKCQKQPFDISSSRVCTASVLMFQCTCDFMCICVHMDAFTYGHAMQTCIV